MKKAEQVKINEAIEDISIRAGVSLDGITRTERLRSCSATVLHTDGRFIFLKSYDTVVAFIDTDTDTLYDILRMVYGYTATSAQHIAKFSRDYGAGKWGCENVLRWYDI